MQTTFWQKLWEAIKEPLRYFILTMVAYVIDYVLANLSGSGLSFELITLITLILRGLDKFIYEIQKSNLSEGESVTGYKGITGI